MQAPHFGRQFSTLASGTVGAQALALAAAPIIGRLYPPADFGVLAIYAAMVAIGVMVASGRYELAIPMAADERSATHLVLLASMLNACASFCGFILLFVLSKSGYQSLMPGLDQYYWLVPIAVIGGGLYQTCSYLAIRAKDFGGLARTRVRQTLAMAFVQISGSPLGTIALICGHAIAQGVGVTSLASLPLHNLHKRAIDWRLMLELARHYRRFPIYSTPSGLLRVSSQVLPPLLFAIKYGVEMAGLVAMSYRVLATPTYALAGALGSVFYSRASRCTRDELSALTWSILRRSFPLVLPAAAIISLTAPAIFPFVLGAQWQQAGTYATWLAYLAAAQFISAPLTSIFQIVDIQKAYVAIQSVTLLAQVAAILWVDMEQEGVASVAVFALLGTSGHLAIVTYAARAAGLGWRALFGLLAESITYLLVVATPTYLAMIYLNGASPPVRSGLLLGSLLLLAVIAVRCFWKTPTDKVTN